MPCPISPRHIVATAAAALVLVTIAPQAKAQTARKNVVETGHRVQFRPGAGRATLIVRRTFQVLSSLGGAIDLDLPPHSSVRSLRAKQGGRWQSGVLLTQEEGAEGFEDAQRKDQGDDGEAKPIPATVATTKFAPLLATQRHNAISVRLPMLRRNTRVTLEYELLAPSCYSDGWHHVAYPVAEPDTDSEFSFVRPKLRGVSVVVAGIPLPKEKDAFSQQGCHDNASSSLVARWRAPAPVPAPSAVSVPPTRDDQAIHLRASWETMAMPKSVSEDLAFGRFEIETPPKISDVPKNLQFVFVLDASHSAHDPKLASQLKIVRGILKHAPDAHVQVVLMQRRATVLFADFVPARLFEREVRKSRSSMLAANGSNVEQALSIASRLLSARKGTLRLVAIGDGKWRSRYTSAMGENALQGLSSRAVFHWLAFEPSTDDGPFRVDELEDEMHTLAHQHGGQGFSVYGTLASHTKVRNELEKVVRPMSIHEFRIEGEHWESNFDARTLSGGTGHYEMFADAALPDAITLHGTLWSQPWKRVVHKPSASPEFGSLAIGHGLADSELSDASLAAFSLAVNTLSRATSFLVRDSSGLYEPHPTALGYGGTGWGST